MIMHINRLFDMSKKHEPKEPTPVQVGHILFGPNTGTAVVSQLSALLGTDIA